MKKALQIVLLQWLLVVSALPALAEVLTLEQALTEAAQANPRYLARQMTAKIRHAEIGPSGALEDPMLSLEGMNYPVNNFSSRAYEMTGNQIMLSQRVPFPGKRGKLEEAATHKYRAEQEKVENAGLTLTKAVTFAYLETYRAQVQARIFKKRLKLIGEILTVARDRYALGRIPQTEILAIEIEQVSHQNDSAEAEKNLRTARASLARLMGRDDLQVAWQVRLLEHQQPRADLSQLESKTLASTHPRVRALREDVKSAAERDHYEKMNMLPDFEVAVAYTQRDAVETGGGDDFASARVGMTLPLWAHDKQNQQREASQLKLERAKLTLREEEVHLAHQIEVARAELAQAEAQVHLYNDSMLKLTRQAVDAARSAYVAREIELRELLNLIDRHFGAELQRVNALVERERRLAELKSLLGRQEESKS